MVVMVGGFLGFLIWLAKIDIDQEFIEYDVYFDESVAGLTKSSVVQYNGIPVGKVKNIKIDPTNPNRVLVNVDIESDVKLREDSVAVLALQGITGVAFVQIEGGSVVAPILVAPEKGKNAVIKSRISPIQELFVSAPDFINQAISVVAKIDDLLNDRNRAAFANILTHTADVSENLALGTKDVEQVVAQLSEAIQNVSSAAKAMEVIAVGKSENGEGDGEGIGGVRSTLFLLNGVLKGANDLMKNMNKLLEANQGAITNFANGTLPEVSRLVVDARRLAVALSSLAESLENDPSGLVFTPSKPEFEPNKK